MGILFVACGITVVLVLALAGLSKLGRAADTAGAMQAFGVPPRLAQRAAPALPVAELCIAACLLIPGLARCGALAATVLLGTLTALVTLALLQDRHPSCNCFGRAGAAPVGWGVALRSLLLTLCAGYLVALGDARLEHGLLIEAGRVAAALGTAVLAALALACVVMLQGWLSLKLVRQQGRLLLKIDNLEHRLAAAGIPASEPMAPRGPAPAFEAVTLSGSPVSSATLLGGGTPALLLFVSADCAPCKDVLTALAAWRAAHPGGERLVIVTSGAAEANRDKLGDLLDGDAVLQREREINALFGVMATPSALRIDAGGAIAAPMAVGRERILALAAGARPGKK
ncbi:redoxin domain-containing protein [Massilia atriviolacea]|uniref:Methylamine utilization protein MauE n=1 Tax=Massilia atriviolacea TaxID=2495579 RepID=A0A430HIK9_9BURK|nr:MauE/DoxX family redox-associated membrane protein [Massilia atriviolacea]RSZ57366.1 redoxin domain-containing protein [Massilia atriviolacea]